MGKYLDIARRLEEQMVGSLGSHIENLDPATFKPAASGGQLDFIDHLTETEREYYLNLLEIMQSPEFGMDREDAEREAGRIIARNRQPLQILQAMQDYKRYGYIKVYSTVLGKAVYLVKNEQVAKQVPDRILPTFLESDVEAMRDLGKEEAKFIMESKILLGGRITN